MDFVDLALDAARVGSEHAAERYRTDFAVEEKRGRNDLVSVVDRDVQDRVVERLWATYPDHDVVGEETAGVSAAANGDGELVDTVPSTGPAWIVDPIDGTVNFVRGVPFWGTSVTLVVNAEPVAAANVFPLTGEEFVADDTTVTKNGDSISVSDRTDPASFSVEPLFRWNAKDRDDFLASVRTIVSRFTDMRRLGCAHAAYGLVATGALDAAFTTLSLNPWDTVGGVHVATLAGATVTDVHGDPWRHDSDGLVVSNGHAHDAVVDAIGDVLD